MRSILIWSEKYDIALDRLLARRLTQSGCVYALATSPAGVQVTVRTRASLMALSEALLNLMCRDLIYFELSRRTDELPLTLAEKQDALRCALSDARPIEPSAGAREELFRYLSETDTLNLEGYLTFRLRAQTELWEKALAHAMAEQCLRRDYAALLSALVQAQTPRMRELYICLGADGSCTFSDDSNVMIEYVDCSEEGILSLLAGMAPAFLTVYDLSDGKCKTLADAIVEAFAGRVRVYR